MKARFLLAPALAALVFACAPVFAAPSGSGMPRALDGAVWAVPKRAAVPALQLSPDAPARTIGLEPVTDAEWTAGMARAGAGGGKHRPLAIGFARDVPAGEGVFALADLDWTPVGGGYRAAHVKLASPGAGGLRIELAISGVTTGISVRFADLGEQGAARIYGPYSPADLDAAGQWSPMLEGDTGLIELVAAPAADLARNRIALTRLAHLDRGPSGAVVKAYPGSAGTAGACNVEIACLESPSQDLLQAVSAVAHIAFVDGGVNYLCTGTLLNSVDAAGAPTQVPYFLTANHCIPDQAAASTIVFSWFFQRGACDSTSPAPYQQTTGGATLLYTSPGTDLTLVQLAEAPPAGAFMAGWDASPLFAGEVVATLHHPAGNPKKYSSGTTNSYAPKIFIPDDSGGPTEFWPDGSPLLRSLIEVHWTRGTTEGGSSGGGLFTRAASGQYRLRGTLWGGGASCSFPDEYDYFGRFDLAFPYMARYLTGAGLQAAGSSAVEFYNVSLDHYFTTAFQAEADAVDRGDAGPGWFRTGYGFKVGPAAAEPVSNVCRFYGNRAAGGPNSHFYTPLPAECAAVKQDPGWIFESPNVYTMPSPDAQNNCPAGTTPVLRAYNNGFVPGKPSDSNHRYSIDPAIYELMRTLGWRGEGTVMCSRL